MICLPGFKAGVVITVMASAGGGQLRHRIIGANYAMPELSPKGCRDCPGAYSRLPVRRAGSPGEGGAGTDWGRWRKGHPTAAVRRPCERSERRTGAAGASRRRARQATGCGRARNGEALAGRRIGRVRCGRRGRRDKGGSLRTNLARCLRAAGTGERCRVRAARTERQLMNVRACEPVPSEGSARNARESHGKVTGMLREATGKL